MADQGTEGLLSPFLRRQRFKVAKPYLNGRILDVGCGSGALAELIDPAWYLGIELDEDSVNKAKQSYPHHFFQNTLPPVEEKFNTVVSLAVIEHVPDPATLLVAFTILGRFKSANSYHDTTSIGRLDSRRGCISWSVQQAC